METDPNAVAAGVTRIKLEYIYDYLSRRIETNVYSNWNGQTYQTCDSSRYIYDGWNLAAGVKGVKGNQGQSRTLRFTKIVILGGAVANQRWWTKISDH